MPVEKKEKVEVAPAPSSSGSDDNLFAALCYLIWLVALFVLFTEKKQNKTLAFHAWQSLIASLIFVVVWVAAMMVLFVISFVTGGLGSILFCLMVPIFLAFIIPMLFAAYKAYQGVKYKFPMLGEFAEKQANK